MTNADVVITMLPTGEHVRVGMDRCAAGGAKGALFIDCSTIDVASARAVHALAAERGVAALDAPVSGGVGGAKAATLTFMVGGSPRPSRAASRFLSAWASGSCIAAMPATARPRKSATT